MKKRIFKVVSIIIFLIGIFFGYYFLNCHFGFGVPCIINELTGLVCPGCGITRMLFSIVKLDFKSAFMYNQLLFVLLPFIIGFIIYYLILYIKGDKDRILSKIPFWVWIVLIIIIIGFFILRNLPMFPFLRP